MARTEAGRTPVTMIERVTLILEAFHSPGEFLTLAAVARRAGLPYSSTHRILDQLIRLEWVTLTPVGYGLGRRGLRFRGEPAGHVGLRSTAGPHLHALHRRTGLAVYLTVLDSYDELVLDGIGACNGGRPSHRVGARRRPARTVGGHAMLSTMPPEEVDTVVGAHAQANGLAVRGRPRAAVAPAPLAALHGELDRIRRRGGLAVARAGAGRRGGTRAGGLSALAAPVAVPGGATAAVCLYSRGPHPVREWSVPLVVQAAKRIGAELRLGAEPVGG